MLSNIKPVPTATQSIGFSATNTGTFNSCISNWSIPCNKAPPPVMHTPRSIISADSSGGVFSRTFLLIERLMKPIHVRLFRFQKNESQSFLVNQLPYHVREFPSIHHGYLDKLFQ